jgi:hypothetical protein
MNGCSARTLYETRKKSYDMRCYYNRPARMFALRDLIARLATAGVGPGEPSNHHRYEKNVAKVHLATWPGFVGIMLAMVGMLVIISSRAVFPKASRPKRRRPSTAGPRHRDVLLQAMQNTEVLVWIGAAATLRAMFAAAWSTAGRGWR